MQGFLSQFFKAGFPFTVLQSDAEFTSVYLRRVSSQSFTRWFKVVNNLLVQGFLPLFYKVVQSRKQFACAGFPPHSFTRGFKVANNLPLQGFLLTHFHGFRASFTTEGWQGHKCPLPGTQDYNVMYCIQYIWLGSAGVLPFPLSNIIINTVKQLSFTKWQGLSHRGTIMLR